MNTKITRHMALKIRAWDRHENCDGLNRLMGSHPPSDDYISNNNSFTKLTMNTLHSFTLSLKRPYIITKKNVSEGLYLTEAKNDESVG